MPDPTNHPLKDQVTLLLVNGTAVEAVESFCVQRGCEPLDAAQMVAEARARITVAADYTRDEQIGLAVSRFNDLYGKAVLGADYRTALAAQKELNRLLGLYAPAGREAAGGDDDAATIRQQIELIAACLLPLNLAGDQYPLEEHARIAAETIRTNGLAKL